MKKLLLIFLLLGSVSCSAQFHNNDVSRKYFYHWESVNTQQVNMEIIIHKESTKVRVTEIKFEKDGKLGQAIVYSTVYVCRNKKNRMVVETVNPSTLQINDSEYILTKDKKLLRVTNNDTIVFQRRY
jgi:hypothetical protein